MDEVIGAIVAIVAVLGGFAIDRLGYGVGLFPNNPDLLHRI